MNFIIRLILSTIAVYLSAYILPGVDVEDFFQAFLVAVSLAILNSVVKPILIILTIPVTIITLGLFLLVINAGLILLAEYLIPGFYVNGFWWALAFSLIYSFIMSIFESLSKDKSEKGKRD